MKGFFYQKFAINSIKKNKKLYFPYILTSSLLVAMLYILLALTQSEIVNSSGFGRSTMLTTLQMGVYVVSFFAVLFLIYTNSFLTKQRNREYALYNVLGMNKKNVSRVLLNETVCLLLLSYVVGIFFGAVFYKLSELLLMNFVRVEITTDLYFSFSSACIVFLIFVGIYALILVKSLLKIALSNPIELLKSKNQGEKPPKANYVFAIIGVILLGAGYALSIFQDDIMQAIFFFFFAVLLVILGTYMLFITGSVAFLKALKKNKKYYYNQKHYVSVSSMLFRMKRNGAGLATICILLTMVLVMLSSTFSLYIGTEKMLEERYPYQMCTEVTWLYPRGDRQSEQEEVVRLVNQVVKEQGASVTNARSHSMLYGAGEVKNGDIELDYKNATGTPVIRTFYVIELADYNRIMGTKESLLPHEVLLYQNREKLPFDTFSVNGGEKFVIKKELESFFSVRSSAAMMFPSVMVVVDDFESMLSQNRVLNKEQTQTPALRSAYLYEYDIDKGENTQKKIQTALLYLETLTQKNRACSFECAAEEKNMLYTLYGGLFFVGIVLSILFVTAMVLIVYYKQIVEGYEDKERFSIMQKVGMSKRSIQKNINAQMLTVFLFPIVMAFVHMVCAFPSIKIMLSGFNLTDAKLFFTVTCVCFALLFVFYLIAYKVTSKLYYDIVSDKQK